MTHRETAYVIVKENGDYWCWDFHNYYPTEWNWSLLKAKYYYDKDEAEEQCKKIRACNEECHIVKIQIGIVKE